MQTKEQMKNWKVVASVATLGVLGVSGFAIANPGSADTPPAIEIEDQRTTESTFTTTTLGEFVVVPGPSFTPGADSLESPITKAPSTTQASVDSPASVNSPANDTPVSVASPANDSPVSVASPVDSPVSVDSPASVDSGNDSLDS